MRAKYVLWVFLFSLFLLGCGAGARSQASSGRLVIATWNAQALFDGEETGYEYPDYSLSAGWTGEKYQARLNMIADAIGRMGAAPDIIALIEVENAKVLEDLIKGPLAKQGYRHSFFGGNRNAALGIGIISRVPFERTLLHSISAQGRTSPRPVLEARLLIGGKPLVLFACHWKSRVDGGEKTEAQRRDSARVVLRRLRELREEDPGIPVIVMGDLNESHDEFFRLGGSVRALMPDDPQAAEAAGHEQTDFLIVSPQKPPRAAAFNRQDESLALYSPWWNELDGGSYNYKGTWETIDHFLLSAALFDGSGWDFDSCALINREPFVKSNGKPYTYNAATGNGLSDHLPLALTLTQAGGTEASGSSAP